MKSKRVLSFIISLTMLLSVVPMNFINASAADSIFNSGSGTETDPYVIVDADQFKNFRNDVLSGNTYEYKYIKLDGYIDLDDEKLAPGGKFSGTLDGNNKVINNFYMNYTDNLPRYVGMFDELSDSGVIKNLSVYSGKMTAYQLVGVIAANNKGRIENCTVNVDITVKKDNSSQVGMIAGENYGTIKDCKTSGKIEYTEGKSGKSDPWLGGIAGRIRGGSIENCCSTVKITSNVDGGALGGIVGVFEYGMGARVSNCYYLEGTAKEGVFGGDKAGQIEKKTADEMKNGLVAYLLQAGREKLVWGQNLILNPYNSPYLTPAKANKVYKITYMVKDAAQENGYKEYAVKYSNQIQNSFPADPSPSDATEYTFDKWVIGQDPYGAAFTKSTTVTGDLTVYAVEREITKATDKDGNASLKQQEEASIKLDDFVENKSGSSDKKFVYSLASGSSLPDGLTLNNGEISGKPTHAGKSTVKISVKNDGLVLMSAAYDSSDSTITLNLDVGLSGEGTEQNPYKILDLSSLEYLRDSVNNENDYNGKYIKLTTDINLNGGRTNQWMPIGSKGFRFRGFFDGDGHTITGLYINDTNTSSGRHKGLFATLASPAVVKNLGVSGTVIAYDNAGGIAATNNSGCTIENCWSSVAVTGNTNIGGIAGTNVGGEIKNCCNIGNVIAKGEDVKPGAIAGYVYSYGKVSNCYYLTGTAEQSAGTLGTKPGTIDAKVKTADEMKNGSVAYLLQNGQSKQVWGQKISSDQYPVLSTNTDDKVYRVRFWEKDENNSYNSEREVHYANAGNTISLPTPGERYFGWSESIGGEKLTDSSYTVKKADNADVDLYALEKQSVTFEVSGTNFIYKTDTPREITVKPSETDINDSDVTVQYYMVEENENVLSSVKAVTNAITAGKYLYVIDIKGEAEEKYYIAKRFSVTDTALPDISQYDNIGYMYIGATEEQQDVFSIEGVPENVYYGDTFDVTAYGANGNVTYEIINGTEIAKIDSITGKIEITGVGRVTIRVKSELAGYDDRYAIRNFEAKKRVLTPGVTAENRTYNGKNSVTVNVNSLENIANGDNISASAKGSMINADAGNGKIVYVSDISLSGDKADMYTLSSASAQTAVNITPIEISGFEISAAGKKYDGTKNAAATVISVRDVLSEDINQVQIVGSAEFDTADSAYGKTVTFSASGLAGSKAANYTLSANEAVASADITPLNVDFVIGQTSFVYDGTDKSISVSASDENGRIFKDYEINYKDEGGNSAVPNGAGSYTAEITLLDSVNYTTTQQSVPVTVNKAAQDSLVIVGLPGTIQYGSSFDLEAVGGESGGAYKWTVKNSADVTLSADNGAVTTVTIGDAVGQRVEIEAVKETENYNDISAKVVFVPSEKDVVFGISDLEQTYGNISEVTVTPSDTEATYDVTYNGGGLPSDAGTYTVNVTANGNYKGMQTATLIINKAQPDGDISGINAVYTYGDDISASVQNLTSGTTAKITYAGTGIYIPREEPPKNAGSYTAILTISGRNYETVTKTKEFVIEKKPLGVKAKNARRAFGEANPVFELEYTGFVNGDNADVILYEPTATAAANASSAVGDYPITVSGGKAENYDFVYDNTGILEITGTTGGQLVIMGAPDTANVGKTYTLYARYGNSIVNAVWTSSDDTIAVIDRNTGVVRVLKSGTVTFTATADDNYSGATAALELNVEKTNVILSARDKVKTYNGSIQHVALVSSNAGFVPILEGNGKNVDITYTLTTDSSVHEPKNVGVYDVSFVINDEAYSGSGDAVLYINKANVEIKPKDISKVYGDKPSFKLVTDSTLITAEELEALANGAVFTCDGADERAAVGEYGITAVLGTSGNDNLIYSIGGTGKLTVTKAPLTVSVKNVTREYGAENPTLEAEYAGFKNDETKDVLSGDLILSYDDSIKADTAVGTYDGKTNASGLYSGNYDITFVPGNVTITKIGVTASTGTARSGYLTVNLDKTVAGLTADNFVVKNGNDSVALTGAAASADNKTYTLRGSFSAAVTYTITVSLANTASDATHEIINGPLSVKPSSGSSGGGGSATVKTYTVTFETNGGSKISSAEIERNGKVTEPAEPTKDGFKFNGWFTDKELKKEYDFSEKVSKSFTLYAAWTENEPEPTDKPSVPEDENPFDDVNKYVWYYDDIIKSVKSGLFNGIGGKAFDPNGSVTRGMFVTVLYRAEGEPAVDSGISFADVAADSYYANAVMWAKQNNIVNGVSENEFAPDSNITREQIAAIIYRYAKYKGTAPTGDWAIRLDYADISEISDYAAESVMYCALKGIMQGKDNNRFAPKDNTTRAEAATILNRFLDANK